MPRAGRFSQRETFEWKVPRGGKKINSFTNSEEKGIGLDKVVPFALETALVKHGAKFQCSDNFQSHVVVNDRVITGQNPMSAMAVGAAIRTALQN